MPIPNDASLPKIALSIVPFYKPIGQKGWLYYLILPQHNKAQTLNNQLGAFIPEIHIQSAPLLHYQKNLA